MEGKRLDLDAPLLSIRRITSRAVREKAVPPNSLRRKALPYFNSDPKAGVVESAGNVPFDWEKTPGQPKDSSVAIGSSFRNSAAPKLPPGRSSKENGADRVRGASKPPESEKVFRTTRHLTCFSDDCYDKAGTEEVEEEAYFTKRVNEEDGFSDARDAFSCAESFSMKCSMSAGAGVRDDSKSLAKDLQVKDFMMGRFLPAAQAMAADSLQRTWRKPPRAPEAYSENSGDQTVKRRLPFDYQYQLSRAQLHATVQEEEDAEEDEGDGTYAGSGFFPSNACGLFNRLCLRSSFGLSNYGPGTKAQVKPVPVIHNRPSPQAEVLRHASLGQTKNEDSWEAVYKHKLSHGYYPHKGEERKLSESNQLTSWSDSQMLDGSSIINSTASAQSLDKHEDPKRESGSWRRGSPDSSEKDYGRYWETTYSHERFQGSGSTSPVNNILLDKVLLHLQETPDCKSSENMPLDTKAIIEYSGNSSAGDCEFQLAEEIVFLETSGGHIMQSRSPEIFESSFSPCCERLNGIEVDGNDLDNIDDSDKSLALKVASLEKNDNSLTLSLVPPPLLTSPSESWLQRTLPFGSSNGPRLHQQSFLGIQLHPKKQISWDSARDHKSITYEKPSKMHLRRTRFAEVAKDT